MINRILVHESITSYVEKLVNIGFENFDALQNHDKYKLLSLVIKSYPNEFMIVNTENYHKSLNHLNNFLISESVNDAFSLAKRLRDNALDYYRDSFNDLFQQALQSKERFKHDKRLRY